MPAQRFFQNRGYETDGEPFRMEGVQHILMRKVLLK
jgi:hypothetical protein